MRMAELQAVAESWRIVALTRAHSADLGRDVDSMVAAARSDVVERVAESAGAIEDSKQRLVFILLATAIVLILVAYGPTLLELIGTTSLNVPGRRVW